MDLKEFRKTKLWKQLVTDDRFAGGTIGWWDALAGFVSYFLVYEEWVGRENLTYPGPTKEEVVREAVRGLPKTLAEEIRKGMRRFLDFPHIKSGGYLENPWVHMWGGRLHPTLDGIMKVEGLLRKYGWEPFPPDAVSPSFVAEIRESLQTLSPTIKWGSPTSLHDFHFAWLQYEIQRGVEESKREGREEVERRRRLLKGSKEAV